MSKGFILWNGGWKCRSYPQAQNHAQKVKSIKTCFTILKLQVHFFCICDWNFDRRRPLICCYLFQLKYWRVRIEFLMPDWKIVLLCNFEVGASHHAKLKWEWRKWCKELSPFLNILVNLIFLSENKI